jgi:hypothetical protein
MGTSRFVAGPAGSMRNSRPYARHFTRADRFFANVLGHEMGLARDRRRGRTSTRSPRAPTKTARAQSPSARWCRGGSRRPRPGPR